MPSDWLYLAGKSDGAELGRSDIRFVPLGGALSLADSDLEQTESNIQVLARAAYTWQNMSARVTANVLDATTNVHARLNGVDQSALNIQIAGNTNGFFEDTDGSVSVADGDLINYRIVAGSGAHGDSLQLHLISGQLQHASLDRPIVIAAAPSTPASVAENTIQFCAVVGACDWNATQSRAEYLLRQNVTFSNMRVVVASNTLDESSFFDFHEDGIRIFPIRIVIAANTTGAFEDTDSESVNSGSTVNYRLGSGAGMSSDTIEFSLVHMLQAGSVSGRNLGATAIDPLKGFNPATTDFASLENSLSLNTSATELNTQVEAPATLEYRDLFIRVVTNTLSTASTTVAFRVNGADSALAFTIAAGSSGVFEDSDTVSVVVDDLLNFSILVASGGTGQISLGMVCIEQGQFVVEDMSHYQSLTPGVVRRVAILAY